MAEERKPVDEARHAELVKKHVYGDPERRPVRGKATWFRATSAASLGIEIAVSVVGGTLIAHWIELRFTHWGPWTTLIGFAVGVGTAVKAIVRTAREFQREIAEREQLEAAAGRPSLADLPDADRAVPRDRADPRDRNDDDERA